MEIEQKITELERGFIVFGEELKATNKLLGKIEIAIEKQNEIHTDVKLLRTEVKNEIKNGFDRVRNIEDRLEKIESHEARIVWAVLSAVGLAILGLVLNK